MITALLHHIATKCQPKGLAINSAWPYAKMAWSRLSNQPIRNLLLLAIDFDSADRTSVLKFGWDDIIVELETSLVGIPKVSFDLNDPKFFDALDKILDQISSKLTARLCSSNRSEFKLINDITETNSRFTAVLFRDVVVPDII